VNIVPINKAKLEPNKNLVDLLQRLLVEAESGNMVGFACVSAFEDNNSSLAYIPARPIVLLGELRILEREIVDSAIQLTKHEAGEPY
jgi:hypothetical protein